MKKLIIISIILLTAFLLLYPWSHKPRVFNFQFYDRSEILNIIPVKVSSEIFELITPTDVITNCQLITFKNNEVEFDLYKKYLMPLPLNSTESGPPHYLYLYPLISGSVGEFKSGSINEINYFPITHGKSLDKSVATRTLYNVEIHENNKIFNSSKCEAYIAYSIDSKEFFIKISENSSGCKVQTQYDPIRKLIIINTYYKIDEEIFFMNTIKYNLKLGKTVELTRALQ
jgi:hypothetical protein